MKAMNNQNKQPQLPDIEEQVADFIRNTSVNELQKIADDTKFIKGTDGREFQANVIGGDEGAVIMPAEAGNGANSGSVLRAKLLKKIYPERTIILLPNATIGNSKAVNLQSKVNPLDAMNENLLKAYEKYAKMGELAVFGVSQGSTVGAHFTADKRSPKGASLIALEMPNVVDRNILKLGIDFAGSGKNLTNVKESYFDNAENDELKDYILRESIVSAALFGAGLLIKDNRRIFGELKKATAKEDLERSLQNGAFVVHAWAKNGISPYLINQEIARDLEHRHKNYISMEYDLRNYDYSITNDLAAILQVERAKKHAANYDHSITNDLAVIIDITALSKSQSKAA